MAKIYYRKYKDRIESGELTVAEALALIDVDVPDRWREAVKEMIKQDYPDA